LKWVAAQGGSCRRVDGKGHAPREVAVRSIVRALILALFRFLSVASSASAEDHGALILTRENKPFFVMFRIYGPEKSVVDGSWILNNIEKVTAH
jgi:hypothetical protein